ncbi:hypothetical protein K431DRAFT_280876 [Polychaeton citri CBS 116435]|uniref:Uncharacterized protein n=1 Tax=Polychaeton citri CBS 116435 TaxID=1314669 RepID=A0A9P4URD4_9PEZI|nr:hypothetical protein K431DRAFT_280876 [Polychaeton citri CBS 116435]
MCLVHAREDEEYEPSRVKYAPRSTRDQTPSPPRSVKSHKHRHHRHRSSATSHRSHRTSYVEEAQAAPPPERARSVRSDVRSTRSGPKSVATWMPPAPPDVPRPPPVPNGYKEGDTLRQTIRTRAPSMRSSRPPPPRDYTPERRTVYESSRSYAVEVERDPPTPPPEPEPIFEPPPPPPPEPEPEPEPEPAPPSSSSSSSSSSTHHTRATSHRSKPRTSYAGTEYSMHELEYERHRSQRAPRDQYATYQYVNGPRDRYRRPPPRDYSREDRPKSQRDDWEENEVLVDDNGRKTRVRW